MLFGNFAVLKVTEYLKDAFLAQSSWKLKRKSRNLQLSITVCQHWKRLRSQNEVREGVNVPIVYQQEQSQTLSGN